MQRLTISQRLKAVTIMSGAWAFAVGLILVVSAAVWTERAEAQSKTGRFYYTVDAITLDQGDEDHNPWVMTRTGIDANFELIFFSQADGFWIIFVCAPLGDHSKILKASNALGDTLPDVKGVLNERASLAAVRGSIVRQWAQNRPSGSIDPLDILWAPRTQC